MSATYALDEALRLWLNRAIIGQDRNKSAVARALGVHHQQLRHWLNGHNQVPLYRLNTIAIYFHFENDLALLSEVRRLYPSPSEDARDSTAPFDAATAARVTAFLKQDTAPKKRRSARSPSGRQGKGRRVVGR